MMGAVKARLATDQLHTGIGQIAPGSFKQPLYLFAACYMAFELSDFLQVMQVLQGHVHYL
jgi:hypothetical protein